MKTLVKESFRVCRELENNRTIEDVLIHLMTEVGELAEEIQIKNGMSSKPEGIDGITGEAIDVILCAIDIIHLHNPDFSNDSDILDFVQSKLEKWKKQN